MQVQWSESLLEVKVDLHLPGLYTEGGLGGSNEPTRLSGCSTSLVRLSALIFLNDKVSHAASAPLGCCMPSVHVRTCIISTI